MKRIITHLSKVLLVLAALGCTAGIVWAQNAHFVGDVTSAIDNQNNLDVKFKIAGLGDNQQILIQAQATADFTCTCVNRSGTCPNAANKVSGSTGVSAIGPFQSQKNGTVARTIQIEAPECPSSKAPTCGGGQTLVLSAISYTGIQIAADLDGALPFEADVGPEAASPSTAAVTLFTCP
jgi:hypothetical protein